MGSKGSKPGETPALTKSEVKYLADPAPANFATSESTLQKSSTTESTSSRGTLDEKNPAKAPPMERYRKFRDDLLGFNLGESAYDFAERLFKENPDDPEVMALLGETTAAYDKIKNKHQRDHWVDRLDLLQRGIDVSRKCIKEHPDFGPCYRSYVLCATRASESLYFYRWMRAVGLMENYKAIKKRGDQGMKLCPDDADIPCALGALSFRCAYAWYNPYRALGWMYGVPTRQVLFREGVKYLEIAAEKDPDSLEIACRLAQSYFQSGDLQNARRWYCKVRDEMPPQSLKDERWQSVAHTQLSTAFAKGRWNVPFA